MAQRPDAPRRTASVPAVIQQPRCPGAKSGVTGPLGASSHVFAAGGMLGLLPWLPQVT